MLREKANPITLYLEAIVITSYVWTFGLHLSREW